MIENPEAEQALLNCAMNSRHGADVLGRLVASDFSDTRHRVIAAVVNDLTNHDTKADYLTVTDELRNRGSLTTPGGAGGLMYVTFIANLTGFSPMNAEHYAEQVRQATRVRMASLVARDLAVAMETEGASGDFDELMRRTRETFDTIPGPLVLVDDDDQDLLDVILTEADQPTEWVIPGWLSREERAVVVAGEGIAKTTLMRQFAVSVAGGLNPWTGQRVADGQRVLYIDAENSRNQSRRGYLWVAGQIVRPMIAPGWKSRILHKTRNGGVDLPGRDRNWFLEVADKFSPDLLIVGPAYKLMRGDPQKDRDVQDLLDVIDKVRVAQRCGVLIETHAPHGQVDSRHMRPYGSSVWLRWPEIGVGFQRETGDHIVQQDRPDHLKALDWRGKREDRDWPDLIRHGDPRKREMPWCPTRDDWAPSVRTSYTIPEGESA